MTVSPHTLWNSPHHKTAPVGLRASLSREGKGPGFRPIFFPWHPYPLGEWEGDRRRGREGGGVPTYSVQPPGAHSSRPAHCPPQGTAVSGRDRRYRKTRVGPNVTLGTAAFSTNDLLCGPENQGKAECEDGGAGVGGRRQETREELELGMLGGGTEGQ